MNSPMPLDSYGLSMLAALALLSSACSSTTQNLPVASESRRNPGKALIVVKRLHALPGGGLAIDVYDNLTLVGKLGKGGELAWERNPGPMNIRLQHWSWNYALGGLENISAGKTYRHTFDYSSSGWYLEGPGIGRISSNAFSPASSPYQSPPPAFDPTNPGSLQNQMLQQKFNEYSTLR